MRTLLAVVLCSLLLASCSTPAPDLTKVRQEVEALIDKAEKDMVSGTMDTTMSQYADDAFSLPNNGPMLRGKEAIKNYFRQMMSTGVKFTDVNFTTVDVSAAGPYVYEVGTYTMTIQIPAMKDIADQGKYLTVYERAADGSLKIKAETWNTDVQPPMQ